jgi:hypothetical protein
VLGGALARRGHVGEAPELGVHQLDVRLEITSDRGRLAASNGQRREGDADGQPEHDVCHLAHPTSFREPEAMGGV